MGTKIEPVGDKFIVHNTCEGTKSEPLTRAGALLSQATDLSPYALIREFFTFPNHWGAGDMKVHVLPDFHDRLDDHYKWVCSIKTNDEVWKKYRECLAELKRQSEEGGDDIDFGV